MIVYTNARHQDNIAHEVDAIASMITKMQLQIKLTLIKVDASTQRHVQFGLIESQRYIQQPPHGMVIPVTRQEGKEIPLPFDFYLISQYNRDLNQVSPVLYTIVKDDLVAGMSG